MAKYGSFKYGSGTKYGGAQLPFDFHVKLYEPTALTGTVLGEWQLGVAGLGPSQPETAVDILRSDVESISWSYNRLGGCGECQIALKRELNSYGLIGPEYLVEVYIVPEISVSRVLAWSGYVEPLSPLLAGRSVSLHARGLSQWMGRVAVPSKTYQSTEVSEIVRDIIDTYVTPASKIKRTAVLNLVKSTGLVRETVTYNTSALAAIDDLATYAGNYEWGVRADREFYFMPRVTTVNHWLVEGAVPDLPSVDSKLPVMLTDFSPQISAHSRINWLYLQGGNGVTYLVKNSDFQTGRQSEAIRLVSSVRSSADATLWGASFLSRVNGLNVKVQERMPGLTKNALNLITPAQDYRRTTFAIVWPTGYVDDGASSEPTVAKHYSRQSDGRVLIFTDTDDGMVMAEYEVNTGGHTAQAVADGLRFSFEGRALPLGNAGFITDRWRGYSLALHSIRYEVTENGMRASLSLGETMTDLGSLHEFIDRKLAELRQGL